MTDRPAPGIYVEPAELVSWLLGCFIVGMLLGGAIWGWLR